MKKRLFGTISILLAAVFVFSAVSMGSMIIPANDNAKEHSKAPENSPVITETPGGNWSLDRIDFIHYAKPGSGSKPSQDPGYKLLGGAWLSFPVSYIINPSNPYGLPESFVTGAISAGAETWDASTSRELLDNAFTTDTSAQYGIQDYKNAIAFGSYPNSGVIAVTSIWITRTRPKQIVEFDMLFNTNFTWGDATVNPSLMDLQNIATHELGHGVGLSDIYSSAYTDVTMYGYSANGETDKRDLAQPDITGLQKLYGN